MLKRVNSSECLQMDAKREQDGHRAGIRSFIPKWILFPSPSSGALRDSAMIGWKGAVSAHGEQGSR